MEREEELVFGTMGSKAFMFSPFCGDEGVELEVGLCSTSQATTALQRGQPQLESQRRALIGCPDHAPKRRAYDWLSWWVETRTQSQRGSLYQCGKQVSPKEDKAINGHHVCGGVTDSMLCVLASLEDNCQSPCPQETNKPRVQEKVTVSGLKLNRTCILGV